MKRIIALLVSLLLCLSFASCDLEGIGNDGGRKEVKDNVTPETTEFLIQGNEETFVEICVEWSDFVRVNGISYDGHFENRVIDESRVGEKLGEILYNVKSNYSSHEEMNAASDRDFTAAFRSIGCEIFAVKDDEDSIAVLDNGKYYLYTHNEGYAIPFEAFGGENYSLPGTNEINRGVAINTFDQLCEAYGGAENMPTDILNRYSGDSLSNITLVVVELISGWGGTEFGIKSVSKSGDDLLVNAVQLDSDGLGDCAMHYWTFFIEIPKTDDKKVIVELDKYDPLAYDAELKKLTYEEIAKYPLWVPGEDYGQYEGQAVLNKYAAEEVLCGMYNYTLGNIEIAYNPTYNFWITQHTRGNGTTVNDICYTVIRAADGKCISQWEDH
ncbi:MAG: hypothetical protein J6S71_04685 [Clostridia bacterium]|nr:hypothetical protein [Clostridia bacterium]